MSKEELNRAQRRRQQREAKAHVPGFWDSIWNRVWVIGLAAGVLGVIVYGAVPKTTQTAAANKPATPATPKPAQQPAPQPPATPPATSAKVETKDEKVGTGAEIKMGDTVTVHYVGTLDDGTKFDSSRDKNTPYTFVVGVNSIEGWTQGIIGMKEGGRRSLVVPPSLGYGSAARPKIPANSTLHFDIEVLKVEPKK